MSKAGNRLIKSAHQARRIARGEMKPARMHVPAEIDVKAIRAKLKLTQDDFATEFGFSVSQIRDWEQSRFRPLDGTRAYLMLIDRNPEIVRKMLNELRAEMIATEASDDDCPPAAHAM